MSGKKKAGELEAAMMKKFQIGEIKKLQNTIYLEVKRNEEKMCVSFSTLYWTWYPFQFREWPDADRGDLVLGQGTYSSSLIGEIADAIELLEKLKSFIEQHKLDTVESLEELLASPPQKAQKVNVHRIIHGILREKEVIVGEEYDAHRASGWWDTPEEARLTKQLPLDAYLIGYAHPGDTHLSLSRICKELGFRDYDEALGHISLMRSQE